MSRLTIRNSDGSVSQPTRTTVPDVFNKLAVYEDLEEAGRLVKLPCKPGDTVYALADGMILNFKIKKIIITAENELEYVADNEAGTLLRGFTFGKDIFLTPEEAEAALEGAE